MGFDGTRHINKSSKIVVIANFLGKFCEFVLRHRHPWRSLWCSTLADANERRDWRIWADFAAVLIRSANKLYADEPLGLDVQIAGNVYALDSSSIKLHTLLDLRGNIPSFIHISDGKMGDVNVLDILPLEAGAFYIMDRGLRLELSVMYGYADEKINICLHPQVARS
jgi:hypothetical protein